MNKAHGLEEALQRERITSALGGSDVGIYRRGRCRMSNDKIVHL